MALTATIKIAVRRGSLIQWNAANPVLLHGEIGMVLSSGAGQFPLGFVVGNGNDDFITLWANANAVFKTGAGLGNMLTSVYDTDDNGIVDASEREQIAVINKTGATLSKGTIVYLKSTSSSANYPEVLKASATTEATSSKTIGGIYEDIPDGQVGYVVTSGQVHNLNTSAYPIGTKLWLSATAGEVTSTPPVQPNHTVFIGTVTRSQTNNGRVLYAIQNGYEIDELHNVKITSVQNGDILKYNSALSLWVNTPKNDWQIDYNEQFLNSIDGITTNFYTSLDFIDNTLRLYMNGLRLSKGATYDYVETNGAGFTMNYAPEPGDILLAEYIKK